MREEGCRRQGNGELECGSQDLFFRAGRDPRDDLLGLTSEETKAQGEVAFPGLFS